MQHLREDKLAEIVVDLETIKRNSLEESAFTKLGDQIKTILKSLFRGYGLPLSIKGRPAEVKSFAEAIKKEKEYIEAIDSYGLEDPKTFKSKFQLKRAVKEFERKTGIRWPFE